MKFQPPKLYTLLTSPKVPTELLWDLSVLFFGLAIVYFAAIFFYRHKFRIKAADTSMRKKILAPMVSEFLFYEEHAGSKEEKNSYINRKVEIRELIKDKKNELVLAEILLDLKKDVSGETRKLLFKLYKDLNLEHQAFDKLKSFKWQKISQGMFELTQMQVLESYSFISRFINDKRSVIRKQAEISTVTLTNEGISYFLDTTKYQISEWQQLKILEVLSNLDYFEAPRFNKWLTSKNKHVVLFSLRLIKYYDQNDAEDSIISLVRHRNTNIKQEAIGCIKKFNFTNSRRTLKAVFWGNNVSIKLAILDALANFGNVDDIPFLESVDKLESNFTVRSKALSSINTIHPEYVMPSDNLERIVLEENYTDAIETIVKESITVMEVDTEMASETIENITENTESVNSPKPSSPKAINFEELELNQEFKKLATYAADDLFEKITEVISTDDVIATKEENSIKEDSFIDILNKVLIKNDTVQIEKIVEEDESKSLDVETLVVKEETKEIEETKLIAESITEIDESATSLPDSYQSIFKSLFEFADEECKLLLLDEILEIGNHKEISFLSTLHNHHNTQVRNKALFVKAKLQEKLTIHEDVEQETRKELETIVEPKLMEVVTEERNLSISPELIQGSANLVEKEEEVFITKSTDGLMPLEFCFLLGELEIKPAKPSGLFDIDFSPEFGTEKTEFNANVISNEGYSDMHDGLTPEENNYFQQLLDFPLTRKDNYNG